MTAPNILLIMTDEERYPPPYETTPRSPSSAATQLPARESLRDGGLEFHRHYAGLDGVRAQPGDVVHRAVPVVARRVADRRARPSRPPIRR